MAQKLPKRSQVKQEYTWNLDTLFTNDESCRRVIKEILEESKSFAEDHQGKLHKYSAEDLVKAIRKFEALLARFYRTGSYTNLRTSTNMEDQEALRLSGEFSQTAAIAGANLQFFQDEIAALDAKKLDQAAELAPEYKTFLADIAAFQKHRLDPKVENALAILSPSLELPSSVYRISKAADMRFPDFDYEGKAYPMSYVLYESHYCEVEDTGLRRAAFAAFSKHLKNYHNINATIYNAQVQKEKTYATMRGFDSVFDYLLFRQKVSRDQYDRHLDLTMERLAPIMQRWARLLQKKYKLDDMRYSDLKVVLMPDYNPAISVEEAVSHIDEAMQVMGEEYRDMVMRFKEERWVDFARNEGKSTGGFCTVPPKAQPYILLNWNDSLSELYTLAHELGHAAQGLLCEKHNSSLEADFTWYDVEAPSTFHEMLLSYSLIKKAEAEGDDKKKARVLAAMIENTYYHNFVTHFLEAYYQREVYRLVDRTTTTASIPTPTVPAWSSPQRCIRG